MENRVLDAFEPKLRAFIESSMTEDAAHDIEHVLRVVATAKKLCAEEHAEPMVVIPAAYLHDCVTFPKDSPLRAQSSIKAADKAVAFLTSIAFPKQYLKPIHHAIAAHSYSANIPTETLEAQIVQDADRLDAIGAIGVARCLQVSTTMGASLYSCNDPFANRRELNDKAYAIDHFRTKLFTLADTMHTKAARAEGQRRNAFMQTFLDQLALEIGESQS